MEFIAAEPGRGFLLPQSHLAGFVARAEVVSGFAIRAHKDSAAKIASQFAPPQLKSARGDEFKIVIMGVNAKRFYHRAVCSVFLWADKPEFGDVGDERDVR